MRFGIMNSHAKQLALWMLLWSAAIPCASAQETNPPLARIADWPMLETMEPLGQTTGVAVDSHNHVFIFHRAGRKWSTPFPSDPIAADTVVMLDADTGRNIATWGRGMFLMPHGLSVDDDDNVWVTDVGSQQVHKFSHDGILQFSLGEAGVQGSDDKHFALPSDVAFFENVAFVSDGYVNTRVVKFSSDDGTYIGEWGSAGSAPGEFDLPHGISTDKDGKIYVADRANSRLQVFNSQGNYLYDWERSIVGRPYGVDVGSNGDVFIIDGGDQPDNTKALLRQLNKDGVSKALIDTSLPDDEAVLGHDIAIGPDGSIYVADVWSNRVHKFVTVK